MEVDLFSDVLAPADTEKMTAACSRQAQQSGQLSSEADLLFDELQDLGKQAWPSWMARRPYESCGNGWPSTCNRRM